MKNIPDDTMISLDEKTKRGKDDECYIIGRRKEKREDLAQCNVSITQQKDTETNANDEMKLYGVKGVVCKRRLNNTVREMVEEKI
jgi:hypothetical protein